MNETLSIYKPHQPTREIGNSFPLCDEEITYVMNGDLIYEVCPSPIAKATVDVIDLRTQETKAVVLYIPAPRANDGCGTEFYQYIRNVVKRLGFSYMGCQDITVVSVDFDLKALFESVPEEEQCPCSL